MSQVFLLALVAVTSAAAYGFGRRWGNAPGSFRDALLRLAETAGLTVLFHVANVMIAAGGILILRWLGVFVSLYPAADPTLLVLSALQAVMFQFWRSGGGDPGKP